MAPTFLVTHIWTVVNFDFSLPLTQNMYELLGTQDFISVNATDIYSRLPNLTVTNLLKAHF